MTEDEKNQVILEFLEAKWFELSNTSKTYGVWHSVETEAVAHKIEEWCCELDGTWNIYYQPSTEEERDALQRLAKWKSLMLNNAATI